MIPTFRSVLTEMPVPDDWKPALRQFKVNRMLTPHIVRKLLGNGANPFSYLVDYAVLKVGNPTMRQLRQWEIDKALEHIEPLSESDFVQRFLEFAELYGEILDDFANPSNWGIYRGRPVIVDLGLSNMVARRHYDVRLHRGSWRLPYKPKE